MKDKDLNPRFDTLLSMYLERRKEVPDVVDVYMLEILTELKKVYDANALSLKECEDRESRRKWRARENMLNSIGKAIRHGLTIHVNDPEPEKGNHNELGQGYIKTHKKWQDGSKIKG